MGKKDREDKEERRESFVDRQSRQKRKNMVIGIAVAIGIVAIIAFAGYHFITKTQASPAHAPAGAGKLGDEHEHASLLVRIFGDKFDFSPQQYQVKSPYIHFEAEDGNTIHRHASNVPLGYLFDSLKIGLTNDCFVFPDKAKTHTFCTDKDYTLKFFINHKQVEGIRDYVLHDDDRILITYGNENQTAIDAQLAELDGQLIKR
ncbi:MAG TPA: protein-disulfide isomerase [Candidatus Nitrosotenuis sp.]|nr:protein-disulfide isomerase [Candidatus Nitrosotenuis sp.]